MRKAEAQYREAQRVADNAKAGEAWVQGILDRIYGWQSKAARLGDLLLPNPEQFKEYDRN